MLGEHHLIHVSEADALVEIDRPLKSYDVPESDEVAKQLASLILQEVPDGATLQLGLGNVLYGHRLRPQKKKMIWVSTLSSSISRCWL